ncbi:hypothetical protein CBE37_01520 [bacterium TMED277]|nr:hypothetical protein [Candidatus Pelagibacter sp.]OUX44224.1 MAG: hypothetical protein CBE37_01520 [bacterium TMED277]
MLEKLAIIDASSFYYCIFHQFFLYNELIMSWLKKKLKQIIFSIFYRDKEVFYEDNFNSLNIIHLLIWNLIKPQRLIERIKYNRFLLPRNIKKIDDNIYISKANSSDDEFAENCAKKLKKYGTLIINEYFSNSTLLKFEEEYKSYFQSLNYNPSNNYSKSEYLPFSKILTNLWFDDAIIKTLEKYMKRMPCARNYAQLGSVTPALSYQDKKNKSNFADKWHIDHSTLIQVAIFFTDVTENSSHMQTLLGSNTYPSVSNPGNLSDEYVKKNNLKIGKCIGKRGTVQIHCGNTFHRFQAVENSTRTWIKFVFSSGNNIQLDPKNIALALKNDFDLNLLNKKSREIISGIFPYNLNKGYNLKNKKLEPTKFQGV